MNKYMVFINDNISVFVLAQKVEVKEDNTLLFLDTNKANEPIIKAMFKPFEYRFFYTEVTSCS